MNRDILIYLDCVTATYLFPIVWANMKAFPQSLCRKLCSSASLSLPETTHNWNSSRTFSGSIGSELVRDTRFFVSLPSESVQLGSKESSNSATSDPSKVWNIDVYV